MKNDPRYFYHSFPRPRQGETHSETAKRGWAILQSMKKLGLILAPEVVEWHTPVNLGPPSPTRITQRRISFTELSPEELTEHSTRFGPFALEFDITELRRAGALPVIYIPQALPEQDDLSLIGPSFVSHLNQIPHTLEQLNNLDQFRDPRYLKRLGAKYVAEDAVINLRNADESRGTIQEFQVPWTAIRDFLEYIQFETAPFNAMLAVISIAEAMLYPTDDDHNDQDLGYYRQREWRISAYYDLNGRPHSRGLQDEEKDLLLEIDEPFWSRDVHTSSPVRRVDEALALVQPTSTELLDQAARIIVPDTFFDQAHHTFGDRVTKISQL